LMPGSKRRTTEKRSQNPDQRRQVQMSGPEIAQLEENLRALLRPDDFVPIRQGHQIPEKLRRDRLLTLPVMLAVVLGLIYRKIAGLSEASRVLWSEGLLWVEPLKVTRQALSARFMKLPARYYAAIFEQALQHFQAKPLPPPRLLGCGDLYDKFPALWIADGSTLEELRQRLKIVGTAGTVLAGRMMVVVELFTHRPVASWYTADATANDKQWLDELIAKLPVGGLLVFDLGFFKFPWFDQFTDEQKYFLTRQREKTAYKVTQALSSGTHYRDEIIQMGQYRSNPCDHPVRMVSVLWGTTWYRYLTNVLDPQQLSAQQVCDLYRRRWQIESAFAITKRLLGLAYLWVGHSNGVEIQIYATWIFYALVNDLCADVAVALNQPLERISLEMVFRGLYHFNNFAKRGEANDVIDFLKTHAKHLGILKAKRPRDQQREALAQVVWGAT
jgi:Transposase DDE domain